MTIFARIFFSLWRIHHLERNGEYLNFLKGDLRGFFFWQSTYVTGSPGKISALYDFFPGSGTFWLQTTVLLYDHIFPIFFLRIEKLFTSRKKRNAMLHDNTSVLLCIDFCFL